MFDYDEKGVRDAAAAYTSIQMQPAQEALLRDLAKMVGPELHLDPIPCKGFWLMAVRAWQIEHATTADTIGAMAPPQRRKAAQQVRTHFERIVRAQLKTAEEHARLTKTLDDAFEHYVIKYSRR